MRSIYAVIIMGAFLSYISLVLGVESDVMQKKVAQALSERDKTILPEVAEEWAKEITEVAFECSGNGLTQTQMDKIVRGLGDKSLTTPNKTSHPLYIEKYKLQAIDRIKHYIKYGDGNGIESGLIDQIEMLINKWSLELIDQFPDSKKEISEVQIRSAKFFSEACENALNPSYKKEISKELMNEMDKYFHECLRKEVQIASKGDMGPNISLLMFAPITRYVPKESSIAEYKDSPEMVAVKKELLERGPEIDAWMNEAEQKASREWQRKRALSIEIARTKTESELLANPANIAELPNSTDEEKTFTLSQTLATNLPNNNSDTAGEDSLKSQDILINEDMSTIGVDNSSLEKRKSGNGNIVLCLIASTLFVSACFIYLIYKKRMSSHLSNNP